MLRNHLNHFLKPDAVVGPVANRGPTLNAFLSQMSFSWTFTLLVTARPAQLPSVCLSIKLHKAQSTKQWVSDVTRMAFKYKDLTKMVYRIVNSPPGYPDDRKYMVIAYENLDLDSRVSSEVARRPTPMTPMGIS